MVPPQIGDAVLVEWRDAVGQHGWLDYADVTTSAHPVITVGVLFAADDTDLTVALTHDDTQVNGYITIPRDWVQRVRVLRRKVAK